MSANTPAAPTKGAARPVPGGRAVHLIVTGVGNAGDSAPSLMVVTETGRYCFNVGEGLQRFCVEHKLRLARLGSVFLTELRGAAVGGLPGLLLTAADAGRSTLAVGGGPGLSSYLFAYRHFLRRDDVALALREVGGGGGGAGTPRLG